MANVVNKQTLEFRSSVNTPEYDPAEWLINPDLTAVFGLPHKYWKLDGDSVVGMTLEERDALSLSELDTLKQTLVDQIDIEVEKRIHGGEGFEWPPSSGQYFSLSANAQNKWIGLMVAKDFISFPLVVPTRHDDVFHAIQNATEAQNMYLTAANTVKTYLALATTAKENIREASTEAEALAAADAYFSGVPAPGSPLGSPE